MHLFTVRLFGEFSAVDSRGAVVGSGNGRLQALIIYLSLKAEGATLEEIARALFGAETARDQAGELVTELRRWLRALPNLLITEGERVRFDSDEVWVDAREFASLAERDTIHSIREATELYRGNLLEGYGFASGAFEEFISERRLHYWRMAISVYGRLLSAQIKAGWWEAAVNTASRLLSLDPSQEVVHRTLMRLQLEQGRPDSAMRRYQECAEILRRDYGRSPSAETEKLREEIDRTLKLEPAPREAFRNPVDRPVLILLVEDDLVSSALIEGYLVEAGYAVVAVADGADALMEIGRRRFDLLLLDINVPTLSGLRLFEIMIQKGIDTPAIFVTGISGAEAEARSLEMGAADFLRKPIRKEQLLPRIRHILQRMQRRAFEARGE